MELEAASYCTACTGGKDVESLLPLIASEMADAVGIFYLFIYFFFCRSHTYILHVSETSPKILLLHIKSTQ